MYNVPKHVLDDICGYVEEKDWSMTKAVEWMHLLDKHGMDIKPAWLFIQVRDNYTSFKSRNLHSHAYSHVSHYVKPVVKIAEKKLCNNRYHEIIYLGTEQVDHELMSLDSFYCPTCNATWQEP